MSGPERAAEVAAKLALLRDCLEQAGAAAIRLRGVDWFAWATAGGSNAVLHTAELGVAEVLVTRDEAVILTDEIEAARLRDEEVPAGFTFHVTPWAQVELRERYVLGLAGEGGVLSDHPRGQELALPNGLRQRRLVLAASEQARYRLLGREAAEAMTEVMHAARPDWTEYQLAGAGAAALWRRGIHPALVLAAGERRMPLYRHPTPSHEPIGARAMLVFCARRHGLYANLTRFVSFGPAPQEQGALMEVEATGLATVTPGKSLSAVYHAFAAAYHHADRQEAINEHHQGGITGYLAREIVATASTATELEEGMAFAFNPSFAGLKIEDTFLLGPQGLDNLTLDPRWPAVSVHGRQRPLWLETN
ncbi:M24 family metallopeptidase [Massilia jejuensis]|uniref:M24 family metallopeptidase n=1 Tax=Massilia jejuensis TaxID=648894 RepID=A0ABW0PI08_9BURK